jgi:nucleoside-diphosphate-sugar epimerase
VSSPKRALLIGGTGPSGPHIVNGLIARGFEVALFHRGTHESDEIPESVEHIHGDPHFAETIQGALGEREFDLVVATYGRTRLLARHLEGRVGRFIAVGSVAATRGHMASDALFPTGLPVPTPETEPTVQAETDADGRFAWRIAQTEREILALHPQATIMRYPIIYGPHQLLPFEWCLTRRALDKRPFVVLPDGGLRLIARGYSVNMAHAVLCAVDRQKEASGQIYNCADERQLTLRQLAEIVAKALGHQWEIVSVPAAIAVPSWPMIFTDPQGSWHRLYDISSIRRELGYRDLVSPVEAVSTTVRWYAERRSALASEIEKQLGDPFDYVTEDQLVSDWRHTIQPLLARYGQDRVSHAHPYAHPKTPGLAQDHRGR